MDRPLKILVIDTERYRKIILSIFTRDTRLRTLSLDAVQAGDGQEGLALFLSHQPDLVITELLLPKMSGFELVRSIRAEPTGAKVPILLTTALARDMTTIHVLKRSFDIQLQVKPFTPWDFALTLQKVLAPILAPTRGRDSERLGPREGQPQGPETRVPRPLTRTPSLIDVRFADSRVTQDSSNAVEVSERPKSQSRRFTQGKLMDHPLPELLLDALEKKLCGPLALRLEKVKKVIYIFAGHPIYAQSNLRRETIGQTLVRKGLLTGDQNNRTLALAKREGVPYGQAVLKMGFLNAQQIKDEILANIRYKIEASLDWTTGDWLFVEDPTIGSKVPRCVLEPVKLIFYGLKKQANIEQSMHRLAGYEDADVHLSSRFTPYREAFIATFGDTMLRVLRDGMTAAQVIQASGTPQETIFQLDVLLRCGLMRLQRGSKPQVFQLRGEPPVTMDTADISEEEIPFTHPGTSISASGIPETQTKS